MLFVRALMMEVFPEPTSPIIQTKEPCWMLKFMFFSVKKSFSGRYVLSASSVDRSCFGW